MLRHASSGLLLEADFDGDHEITDKELRAAYYKRTLGEDIKQIKIEEADHITKRYAPWLEKALKKMGHSRKTWSQFNEKRVAEEKQKEKEENQRHQQFTTIWEAAVEGHVMEVRRFLIHDQFDLSSHNYQDGGQTVFHYACWHGHLELLLYLIKHMKEEDGVSEEYVAMVLNSTDTTYHRATPLILACRSTQGTLRDRLAIVKKLADSGAVVEAQDAFGDNALHWAARRSSIPIVRYLLKGTDAAVFASMMDNFKRQKPIDIARQQCKKKRNMSTTEVYAMLQHSLKGCNMRIKIQQGKKLRENEQKVALRKEQDNELLIMENARVLTQKLESYWSIQHERAEQERRRAEEQQLEAAGKRAVGEITAWIETKEGKSFVKNATKAATEQIKQMVRSGEMGKPKDMKKAALNRAKMNCIQQKETEAREKTRARFREVNPSLIEFDAKHFKRLMETASR